VEEGKEEMEALLFRPILTKDSSEHHLRPIYDLFESTEKSVPRRQMSQR